ncbi:putative Holliday junction resolvase [Alicyclobacillus sacchari]|uniref:Putative pre-16S rRNA nuclease n=2 Tax=Alicyclobacillus sacchari TaxID=392010 RepID=A0A4R8LP36_9BACL|nr:Holliday junction resolvase RuvX [Alicyclobacillus sacchari]TDY48047.1 putative Holliday junction resolvase [Alicyclobacillus sacchari]
MPHFTAMRTLAVDYGERRVGIALSDPTGLIASALTVIQRETDEQVVDVITGLVAQHGVERIIVGNPITMKGEAGEKSQRAAAFAMQLGARLNVPVELFDERLTTVSAERALLEGDVRRKRRRNVIDAVAATILLQHYLDAHR